MYTYAISISYILLIISRVTLTVGKPNITHCRLGNDIDTKLCNNAKVKTKVKVIKHTWHKIKLHSIQLRKSTNKQVSITGFT